MLLEHFFIPKNFLSSRLMLGIEQKKGVSDILCGKLVAYAKILPAIDQEGAPEPFQNMARNGLLVIEGDFRQNNTFKQFLQREMGENFDENIAGLLERIREEGGELPEGLDAETIRERVNELSNMEVIPIPAKIVHRTSEEEILKDDADIFYIGEFRGVGQAHFCLTSLPIYYQAKYKEQIKITEQLYLEELLSQIDFPKTLDTKELKDNAELFPANASLSSFIGNLQELFDSKIIPFLLLQKTDAEFENGIEQLNHFMAPYSHKEDLKQVYKTLKILRTDSANEIERKRLELLCNKISNVYHENFRKIPKIMDALKELNSQAE